MSLEVFGGFDAQEGMSAASLEQLRERMKAAAAQIAAIRKEEGKQKKKEDELQKLLLKFIQHSHKKDLVHLISLCLAENIPAVFILAIVLLGNEEIQQELGRFLLGPGAIEQNEQALVFFREDQSLPLKIKIELDQWLKALLENAEGYPQKLLKFAYFIEEEEKKIKPVLVNLMAHVLGSYLAGKDQPEPPEKLQSFCRFTLTGILNKTAENLDNRKMLN